MKGEFLYENNIITAVAVLLISIFSLLFYYSYGWAVSAGILLLLPILYALKRSKASFSTNGDRLVFKSGILKRTINFADIYSTSCYVTSSGARGFVNYYIVLAITLQNGKKYKIKSPFIISSDTVLNDRKEYESKVRSHCLSRLDEYINSKIHFNVRI